MATDGLALRVAALALALAQPCAEAASAGAILVQGDGTVRLHVRHALQTGQWVAVQFKTASGELRCCKRIRAERFVLLADADEGSQDMVSGQPTKAYQYTPPTTTQSGQPYAGMAVVFDSAFTAGRSTGAALRAAVDGKPFSVRLCTSAEGFRVQQGPKAQPVQDLYVALPYAIETPTCPSR